MAPLHNPMASLIATLSLVLAIILQTTIIVQINMLNGAADLVLLTLLGWVIHEPTDTHWRWGILAGYLVGLSTALPLWIPLLEYLLVIFLLSRLQTRLWQAPMLIYFATIFFGTFIIFSIDFIYLLLSGEPFALETSINYFLLPSLVLNVLFALPVYGIMGELAKQVYPPEVET